MYYILGENIAAGQPATQSDTLWDFGPGWTFLEIIGGNQEKKITADFPPSNKLLCRFYYWKCYSDSFIFSGMKYESFLHIMMTGIPDVKTFLTKFSKIFKPHWQFWMCHFFYQISKLLKYFLNKYLQSWQWMEIWTRRAASPRGLLTSDGGR